MRRFILVLVLSAMPFCANAIVDRWILQDVVFDDDGTATGNFDFEVSEAGRSAAFDKYCSKAHVLNTRIAVRIG
jgi:hypothetical protein